MGAGTFGGNNFLDQNHERRVSGAGADFSYNNAQATNEVLVGDNGMMSFQPGGALEANPNFNQQDMR